MSEEQVLPEFDPIKTLEDAARWSIRASRQNWEDDIIDVKVAATSAPKTILKLFASLAQSEAERERLRADAMKSTEELSYAKAGAMCPVCVGDPITGKLCICGGSNDAHDAYTNCLRDSLEIEAELRAELARERELHQWQQIMPDTQLTSDMEVGRWMGRKWVITRMEAKSEGWTYIHPNDFFTHYRALNPPALLEDKSKPVATTSARESKQDG